MTSTVKADVVTAQTTNGDVTVQGNGTGEVNLGTLKNSIWTTGTEADMSSGSSTTFSSIPSGVKQIIIMFNETSNTTGNRILVTIGDSGGLETSGYVSTSMESLSAGAVTAFASTSDFIMALQSTPAISGTMVLTLEDPANFTWVASHSMKFTTTRTMHGGGSKSLSAELTQLRIASPTDFDGGSINIMYM
ncbi:MAG: hypothetical protein CME71_11630 [Halobacteriovorax sp.]|nr:hypothetical protein [Halobacteriovorax sp.]